MTTEGFGLALTIVVTIGKYLLLVGIYAFVLVVFRGMLRQLAAESAQDREGARPVTMRRAAVPAPGSRPGPPKAPRPATPPRTVMPAPVPPIQPERPAEPEPEPVAEPVAAMASPSSAPVREAEPVPAVSRLHVIESSDPRLAPGDDLPLSAAVTLGRGEDNSLRLEDRFVSGRHALIYLRDGRRLLMDRGSTNGTFVNGKRVEAEVELRPGDRIALGNTVFEYREG